MGIELAIATALASAGASAAAAAAISAFVVNTVVSLALGALASALSPKPKTPNLSGGFAAKASGLTQNIKQPITSRRILYGEARIGGALTFIETTNNDKFMHLIITLCDHECEAITEIQFNGTSIPLDAIDGNGDVTSGDYADRARIKIHLGSPTQVADADLVAETSATTNFRGRGVTYLYVTLEFDRDIYPSSVPTITAWTKGKKILDPRDAVTRWTPNGALFSYDYLTLPLDDLTPGVGVDVLDIDETYLNASSNIADEMVTTTALVDTISAGDAATDILTLNGVNDKLQYQSGDRVQVTGGSLPAGLALLTDYYVIPYQRKTTVRIQLATSLANALAGTAVTITGDGSGTITKTAEPRFYGGGIVETSEQTKEILDDLLTTIGGSAIFVGGQWKIKAASYHTPVYSFDEDQIISQITVRTKVSRRERFNLIKGVYVSPLNEGEPADYPIVQNSTAQTNDGRVLPTDYDLPMTQRPHTAQRLAKIKLEKHRQELFFEATFSMEAMQVQPGDVVNLTNTRLGWASKPFEVVTWGLQSNESDGVPTYSVRMALQETASAVYDWNNGEETIVDPAPDTNLPNPLQVNPPTGLAVVPREVRTANGDLTYEFEITWTAPTNIFVINGGKYEVGFRKSSETVFRTSYDAKDDDEQITVKQIDPGINYDCRVRAVNQLGVRSSWQNLFGFNINSPSGATIKIDYGLITGSVVESIDLGLITDAHSAANDYGNIGAEPETFATAFAAAFK